MATTLFNQWVIHSGPRIRLTATTDYYRDGAYMYYRINTYIHNLDYSQSWYGWYLDMAVYIDGQYMGTTRLKQNKPIIDGRVLVIRHRIMLLSVFLAMPISRLY